MSRFLKIFIASVMMIAVFLPNMALADTADVAVTVDLSPDNFIKPSTKLLLGINNDWPSTTNEPEMKNGAGTEITEDYIHFWESNAMPFTNSRRGGGSSNTYDWTSLVGPLEERTAKEHSITYGIPQWLKVAYELEEEPAFTAVINLDDEPEKSADLVRYLTLKPDDANATNPNTGINWAQKRVDDGIEKPANIIAFELGNELYWRYCQAAGAHPWSGATEANVTAAAKMYTDFCKPVIDAVRKVNPDVKLSGISNSGAEIDGAFNVTSWWNKTVVDELGDYCGGACGNGCTGSCFGKGINYVTHHDYYWYARTHSENNKHSKFSADKIYGRISEHFGGRDIKIMITEHNMLYNSPTTPQDMDSLTYALRIADFLCSVYNVPEVYTANHHGSYSEDFKAYWAIGRRMSEDGKMYITPNGGVLAIFAEAAGGNVAKTTVNKTGVLADKDDAVMTSAHLKEDGRLDLVLVNRNDSTAKNVAVTIQNANTAYKLESVSYMTGDPAANNTYSNPEAAIVRRELVNATEEFTGYTMPPCSVAVLHLVPQYSAPLEDETGSIEIEKRDNQLRVTDKLYHKDGLRGKFASAVLLKCGADPENYRETDIYSVAQTTVENDIAYFTLPIGDDFENGKHHIVITADNFTQYAVYDNGVIDEIVIENADRTDYEYNGKLYSEISNSEYRVDLNAVLNENAAKDTVLGATVVYGDKSEVAAYGDSDIHRVAYTAPLERNRMSVYMPQNALSGVYTIIVGANSGENSSKEMHSFYFTKPDEEIMLVSPPHTLDGKDITLMTDLSQTVYVELKQLVTEDVTANVFIGYYKEGKLINTSADAVTLVNGQPQTAELVAENTDEAPDCAKLFIWKNGSIEPLMRTYVIK